MPRLLSSAACHYEVEWETEYACPVDNLISHSCQLNIDQHGVHVDLSPLASGQYYDKLFNLILNSQHHVLHTILPGHSDYNYNFRPMCHNFVLTSKSLSITDKDFITRMIY